jgi:hypothetical protein
VIPHITKGSDLGGLMRYLVGRGRANEHENPHVVGGDGFLQAWHGHDELSVQAAADITAYLEEPRLKYGVEMMAKVVRQNPDTGAREPVLDADGQQVWRDVNVWHCSLSLPAGEVLSSEQWETVTREFADGMNLTDAGGRSPVRWVAIHHGASKNGNDHVHIAASMVREDGTRWEGRFRDWPTAQQVCRTLEAKHHLTPVLGGQHGTATRGPSRVELADQHRSGAPTIQRDLLALRVRAAAVAAGSEAEWLRRVRADGVLVMPRFAEGTTDVVAGYRAALKGEDRLRFYGGGQLGRDLSLPRLRELWPAPSVEVAGEASAEWQAAFRGQRTGVIGREAIELSRAAPDVAARNLAAFSDRLASVPVTDRVAWSIAAREVSGALSAWAQVDHANARVLREAAAVVGRAGQDRRPGAGPGLRDRSSAMGAALVLMASRGDKPQVATAALVAQLIRAAAAVRDYHREVRNTREAQAVDVQLRHLARLQLSSAAPEPAAQSDRRRPAQLPKQQLRPRGPHGPALELPHLIDPPQPAPGWQTPIRSGPERQDRNGGR